MDVSKLGKKIKELREQAGMDQQAIADIFGFTGYQQISKWETGKSYPSIDQILVLNDKFNYNLFNVLSDPVEDYKEVYFRMLQEEQAERQRLYVKFKEHEDRIFAKMQEQITEQSIALKKELELRIQTEKEEAARRNAANFDVLQKTTQHPPPVQDEHKKVSRFEKTSADKSGARDHRDGQGSTHAKDKANKAKDKH